MSAGSQAGSHKNSTTGCGKWLCLQRELTRENAENPSIIPLTEYLEYFRKRQGCKSLKLKAGDGDRTRDVQLGKLAFYR
jgi:hypothetical protein